MWKRWLVLGLVLVILSLGVVGVYLWLRFDPTRTKLVMTPTPISIFTNKDEWARTILAKFPYNKELHAGILLSKKPDEVWIVGKGGLDASDPKTFLMIDLGIEAVRVKITPETKFATQVDADLDPSVEIASSSAIQLGDLLIIKATVEKENVVALVIRKLNIINNP